jgi:hypothetical protein
VLVSSCTPREIEQQDTMREMPRPGGADQERLDSIKRELSIKRQQQGALEAGGKYQLAMDSLKYDFLIKPYLEGSKNR